MKNKVFPVGSDVEAEALSTDQLISNLHHFSHHYRGRAVTALGKRLKESETVFDKILETINNPINRNSRVLGLTTVSWLGAIAVFENGNKEQIEQINSILKNWEKTEKEDLKYFLRHTGLPLDF
ncbi:hypothetical protein HNQ93_002134 [Hymenobacter luteus]|uniref:Uncharacterized protein n=2 Tax=Hymenobacter TaxID=89966 RepID=A0A7W9WAZ3_9BACT|nr:MULTISPECIES: hypothetical protein [Hymenobacter]MBB4602297.1 hypothetical protein [Hymenobacter latericoloratus]MBB6059274.1 hypothetical protein [Hymenobacter luteus]